MDRHKRAVWFLLLCARTPISHGATAHSSTAAQHRKTVHNIYAFQFFAYSVGWVSVSVALRCVARDLHVGCCWLADSPPQSLRALYSRALIMPRPRCALPQPLDAAVHAHMNVRVIAQRLAKGLRTLPGAASEMIAFAGNRLNRKTTTVGGTCAEWRRIYPINVGLNVHVAQAKSLICV